MMMLTFLAILSGAGIALAWLFYIARPGLPDSLAATFSGLYKLIYNKYFVDEIYAAVVVNPVVSGSREVLWKGVDSAVIDGAVNGAATVSQGVGGLLKRLQSGNIRSYAVWVLLGAVLLLVAMGLAAGGMR